MRRSVSGYGCNNIAVLAVDISKLVGMIASSPVASLYDIAVGI